MAPYAGTLVPWAVQMGKKAVPAEYLEINKILRLL
jgi:hypothetical protein